jgi:hypothetical protein
MLVVYYVMLRLLLSYVMLRYVMSCYVNLRYITLRFVSGPYASTFENFLICRVRCLSSKWQCLTLAFVHKGQRKIMFEMAWYFACMLVSLFYNPETLNTIEGKTSRIRLAVVCCVLFNPLKTKRRPLYLKTQYVPRCKHFSSRL